MKKILLIDDEKDMLVIFKTVLSSAGYQVITAGNGKDGAIAAKNQKPDLIFLDIRMPGMSGVTTSDVLGNDPVTRNIPIVYLSNLIKKNQVSDGHVAGSKIGDLHFLPKACSNDELLREVRKHIGTPHEPSDSPRVI